MSERRIVPIAMINADQLQENNNRRFTFINTGGVKESESITEGLARNGDSVKSWEYNGKRYFHKGFTGWYLSYHRRMYRFNSKARIRKYLVKTLIFIFMSFCGYAQIQVPPAAQTYFFTEEFYAGISLNTSCELKGVKGDDFNLLYSMKDSVFGLMIIDGNIRYSDVQHFKTGAKVYIHPGSQVIFSRPHFMSGDTVYNAGSFTLSSFTAQDSVIIINVGAGRAFTDVTEVSEGESISGNCGGGRAIILRTNDYFVTGVTGIPDRHLRVYDEKILRVFDLSGRLVRKGGDMAGLPTGIYIVDRGTGKGQKIYIK